MVLLSGLLRSRVPENGLVQIILNQENITISLKISGKLLDLKKQGVFNEMGNSIYYFIWICSFQCK